MDIIILEVQSRIVLSHVYMVQRLLTSQLKVLVLELETPNGCFFNCIRKIGYKGNVKQEIYNIANFKILEKEKLNIQTLFQNQKYNECKLWTFFRFCIESRLH